MTNEIQRHTRRKGWNSNMVKLIDVIPGEICLLHHSYILEIPSEV